MSTETHPAVSEAMREAVAPLEEVAEAINRARYFDVDGVARGLPYRTLAESGSSDRAYCTKLARAVLHPAGPISAGVVRLMGGIRALTVAYTAAGESANLAEARAEAAEAETARLTGERDAAVALADARLDLMWKAVLSEDDQAEVRQDYVFRLLAKQKRAAEAETARLRAALADALAQGRREGLEAAAKVATGHADAMEGNPPTSGERVASHIAADILARRATAPAETQKPEETA